MQTFVLPASRVMVRMSELSEITRLPFASVTSIWSVELEPGSAEIGLVRNVEMVLVAAPGPPLVTMTLQPVRPVAEAESWMSPGVFVDAIETVATPLTGVTTPVGVIVARAGVTLTTVICGVLALLTVFPLASLSLIVATAVPFGPPPLAMIALGVAVQPSCVA